MADGVGERQQDEAKGDGDSQLADGLDAEDGRANGEQDENERPDRLGERLEGQVRSRCPMRVLPSREAVEQRVLRAGV